MPAAPGTWLTAWTDVTIPGVSASRAIAAAVVVVVTGVAHAQSLPPEGATGVPANFVPVLQAAVDRETLRLTDDAGVEVPFTVTELGASVSPSGSSGSYAYEIHPEALLSPRTTYTLTWSYRGMWRSDHSFQTGSGPVRVVTPRVPRVTAEVTAVRAETGYLPFMACLLAEGAEFVDVTVFDGTTLEVIHRIVREG